MLSGMEYVLYARLSLLKDFCELHTLKSLHYSMAHTVDILCTVCVQIADGEQRTG